MEEIEKARAMDLYLISKSKATGVATCTRVRIRTFPSEFCFHGLRHTYASQLIQSGTPVIVVAEQLGNRNIETVSRTYGQLAADFRLAEVRRGFASLTRL